MTQAPPVAPAATPAPTTTPTKHSGFGIASFVLSLFGCTGLALLIALCAFAVALRPNALDGEGVGTMAVGLLAIGLVALEMLALVFGVLGCLDRARRRGLAIAGLVLAGVAVLGIFALVVLGNLE
ncbi:MAG: hypothetical protein IT453_01265 [Planctomycetes bacterium]|nr:hypothetical protein [Planctomycetota bacterium]